MGTMIKVVTDSASGIGKDLAENLGVEVIQIPILVDEQEIKADFKKQCY